MLSFRCQQPVSLRVQTCEILTDCGSRAWLGVTRYVSLPTTNALQTAISTEACKAEQSRALNPDTIEKPKRTIGTMEILAASFNILNTWFGLASTLVLGFSNGGPVTIIYGLILISIVYTATAFSLAELSAKYPTAGGQYHWTSLLASPATKRAFVRFLS